jgi:branched-chain amino acid aminotransferase
MDRLGPATVVIIAQHEEAGRAQALDRGLSAQVVSLRRVPSQCIDARVKSCNYINNVLAYLEAKHAGADTAIMLDIAGNVAEGYGSNIFAVRRGRVITPALGDILEGITRETVLDLCREAAIPTEETLLSVYDLLTADEVFETATLAEISPIIAVNGRPIGAGKVGPIARQLHAALRKLMVEGRMSTPVLPL